MIGTKRTPLEYLLEIMNNPLADPLRRDKAAVAAAAYIHPKAGEGGKKDEVPPINSLPRVTYN